MVTVIYEVDDGYCGGSRPQKVEVDNEELLELETEQERKDFIIDMVDEHFRNNIGTHIKDYGLDELNDANSGDGEQ